MAKNIFFKINNKKMNREIINRFFNEYDYSVKI